MARFASLDPDTRRKLEIALAVSTQRAEDVHVRQALELLTHAHGRVPFERSLAIHERIHGLPAEAARALRKRVLAALGQADLRPDDSAETGRRNGPLARIRRRLRGRRDAELRRWVEFHKGRTDRDLVEVHVDAIARVLRAVAGGSSVADAVDWYAEGRGLSGAMRDNVYLAALARLDDSARAGDEIDFGPSESPRKRKAGGGSAAAKTEVEPRFKAVGD
ncbi:MAG: hypothetical protein ABFS34_04260 [Gemmatimonadota bacterium]